jgi:hypothetical protein
MRRQIDRRDDRRGDRELGLGRERAQSLPFAARCALVELPESRTLASSSFASRLKVRRRHNGDRAAARHAAGIARRWLVLATQTRTCENQPLAFDPLLKYGRHRLPCVPCQRRILSAIPKGRKPWAGNRRSLASGQARGRARVRRPTPSVHPAGDRRTREIP